ncbi:insulinase family protein [candidate division WOR-3 bacterium]|nr:insulinase family protein [candidate division WOR-3 bacterium]
MRRFIPLFIILAFSLWAEKESPISKDIRKMEFPQLEWNLPEVGKEIERVELPSGAILFLKENHTVPLIEINIYIKGGSSYLKEGEKATSEFFASMIERGGTQNFAPSEFTEKLEINAISFRVNENGYYYSVNELTSKDVLDTALILLKEALFHPSFDDQIIEIEKKKITEEWKKKLDEPNSLLRELSTYMLYRGHPEGSIPDLNLLKSTNQKRLKELKNRFLQPSNMIIGIVGDFKTPKMKERIENIFCDKYNTGAHVGNIPPLTKETQKKVYFYDMKRAQAYFNIQHRGEKAIFPEMFNVMIMNQILGGGGFTSRIVLKVRNEMGLAYRTRSSYSTFSPISGTFSAYCGTSSSTAHQASEYILKEFENIRDKKVSIEELKVAKESLINSTVTRLGNDWDYIQRLLSLELLGLPLDYYLSYNDNIEKVTLNDVLNAAQDFINPEKLAIVIIGDRDKTNMDALREQFGEVEFIEYKIPGL